MRSVLDVGTFCLFFLVELKKTLDGNWIWSQVLSYRRSSPPSTLPIPASPCLASSNVI